MQRFKPKFLFNFTHTIQGTQQLMPGSSALSLRGSSALALSLSTSTAVNPLVKSLGVYHKKIYPSLERQKSQLRTLKEHEENVKAMAESLQQCFDDFVFHKDIKQKISSNTLTSAELALALRIVYEKTEYTESDKAFVYALKDYLSINKPTIKEAYLFLDIWNKGNFVYVPKMFVLKDKEKSVFESLENFSNIETRSFKEKQEEAHHKMVKITKNMQDFFHENKIENILESPLLLEWHFYISNRTQAIPFSKEELVIHEMLLDLYEKKKPNAEILLRNKKDNLKKLKEECNLPLSLKEQEIPSIEDCFLPQDFLQSILLIEQALFCLNNEKALTETAYKLLAIKSGVAVVDDEGTFKLTEEAYKSFNKYAKELQLEYHEDTPYVENTLEQIKNKNFVIANDIEKQPHAIVNSAHLSHKSLVSAVNGPDIRMYARPCILTSTNDSTTILIDKYQQTNPDLQKQSKGQYIRIFNNAILISKEEFETLTVDLETTLLFHSCNSDGMHINKILYDALLAKKDSLSNCPYLLSYVIDENFIKKLTIKFYEQQLELYKQKYDKLHSELVHLTKDKQNAILEQLQTEKDEQKLKKIKEQYYSLLPKQLRILYQAITVSQEKINKKEEQKQREEKSKIIKKLMAERKQHSEEEQRNKPKSAKQRREEHQATKASEKVSKPNINEKDF